jgi:hypothetical protein
MTDRFIDELPRDLKRTVRENWTYCRDLRVRSATQEISRDN